MKIVITGASGYVGQNIVPILKDQCEALLLVGRDVEKLANIFPDVPICTYEEIPKHAHGYDSMVHLSVLNNDSSGSEVNFREVNVDLAIETAKVAAECGIRKFYNVSSIHVLDERNVTIYAKSKREAVRRLAEISNIEVTNVYLPFVRGGKWNGKLAFLNCTPLIIARPLQACLLAVKPTVKSERLARYILQSIAPQHMVILSEGQLNSSTFNVLKRGVDLVFALAVITLLWWALLIVWAVVRASSPGPGIFAQERVGLHGKKFVCYKFRTMQQGTVQAGTHEVSQASVTAPGRFLRATKLDELPQVWNILKNEISLIGPRPGLPVQKELYEARQSRGVFDIKPGISGLAQVNNVDMSDPEKLADWDAKYIALQSLLLDFKITLATVRGSGQGDKTHQQECE